LAWGTAVVRAVAEWTRVFCQKNPELPEAETLQVLLRWFGYEGFDLPLSITALTDNAQVLSPP